jgi:predicted PurR-regulated permease PerM
MKKQSNIWLWIVGFLALVGFLVAIKGILLPFVVALIAAYFLDPAADKLESFGLSRTLATVTITASFFASLGCVVLLLGPLLYDQLRSFLTKIPEYTDFFMHNLLPSLKNLLNSLDPDALDNAKDSLRQASGTLIGLSGTLLQNIWSSGLAVVNILSLIFVTPVVTFYILRDWDRLIAKANGLLPPAYAFTIRQQAKEIDRTLSGYIRGQTHVCLLLGIFYSIGLSLAGLEFGLFIGMATGILSFIPYVGMLFGFLTGMLMAYFQFDGSLIHLGLIASIFIIGQVLEGNVVAPKLVGDRVGLHPIWLIFGMLTGAALFGFTGILLAVPVTSVIGVLVRFAVSRYLESDLYQERS